MSGAHANLKVHGTTSKAVRVVILVIDTSAKRSQVGSASQMNPIGAPSLKYNAENSSLRRVRVERKSMLVCI